MDSGWESKHFIYRNKKKKEIWDLNPLFTLYKKQRCLAVQRLRNQDPRYNVVSEVILSTFKVERLTSAIVQPTEVFVSKVSYIYMCIYVTKTMWEKERKNRTGVSLCVHGAITPQFIYEKVYKRKKQLVVVKGDW